MRFRASVGAIGLALAAAAPVYAQSAGAIEVGVFGRMQFHDKQLLLPTSVSDTRFAPRRWEGVTGETVIAAPANMTQSSGFGYGARLGYFFMDNWSVEAGYHFVRQPAIRNTNLTLRALYNRPLGESISWFGGLGVLSNSYTLAPYTGTNSTSGTTLYYAGSDGVTDIGLSGLIGARWRFTDAFQLRLDGTASFIPSPSKRRDTNLRPDCAAGAAPASGAVPGRTYLDPLAPACAGAQSPGGADLNLGAELGASFLINNAKDSDGDGVKDKADACPNTPKDVKVDVNGCPIDTDGDKVADYLDKCPNTPKGVAVDANGCPVDSDKDGVADYLDKCPNTPAGAKVDNNGCPLDSDSDGVADYMDKCPNTPKGVKVDAAGCPIDSDKDGVADYLDKCPNTAPGVKVDKDGCSLDNDGDGVPDNVDKCPNTLPGVQVDSTGCALDSDKDGVADYLDKCPNTKAGLAVDARGCPRIFEEGKSSLTLTGLNFATGTARIAPASRAALDKLADALAGNPSVTVEISGHTDNRGNAKANLRLSQQRADAVKKYLVGKGVADKQVVAKGYGGTQPTADNKTAAGRAANRRVEMKQTN